MQKKKIRTNHPVFVFDRNRDGSVSRNCYTRLGLKIYRVKKAERLARIGETLITLLEFFHEVVPRTMLRR